MSTDDEAEGKAADQDRARLAKDSRYATAAAVDHMIHDPFPPPTDAAMMQRLIDTGALDFADPASAGPRFAKAIAGMTD